MLRKVLIVIGIVFLIVLLLGGSFAAGLLTYHYFNKARMQRYTSSSSNELINEAMWIIKHSYVERVSNGKLVRGAIRGMVEALDDPYSHYFSPSKFEMFEEHTKGHFFGVGIEIGMRDDQLTIISPMAGTPAEQAGLEAGDKITAIDGKSTKEMSLEQAVKLIRGEEGTKVALTVEREKEKPKDYKITRARIDIPNVTAKILDDNIGYIRIHTFNDDTKENFQKELDRLKREGAKGIILDLRYNPGGLLVESVGVASQFIEDGTIVKVASRSGKVRTYDARGDADEDIPLVVLVNKGSASASEIVAGALKDHKRAVIVGERTFGKASVQTVETLSDGSGIVITTDLYYTPKGKSIHKKGIKPDVEVKVKRGKKKKEELLGEGDKQLNKAKEILKDIMSGKIKKAA